GELHAPGSTYVTTQNPAELQAEVEAILVSSLAVSPKDTTIGIGETLQLSVAIQPEDALDPTVTWTTSDAAIATVDANGLVTAHGEGTVTITATANDGSGCFDTATVVVVKKAGNASQPKTGDDFPMGAFLLFGCLSMLMAILSISNLGKKRNEG
ncbi:MAG: Ig-like domain-containing protein, partial [Lachnospiraceae bacterium]|nr:Ig-like domain-containing protein [Lachnospiraceae bacterium]